MKFLPMFRFELWISGVVSNRSTNWATTTAQVGINFLHSRRKSPCVRKVPLHQKSPMPWSLTNLTKSCPKNTPHLLLAVSWTCEMIFSLGLFCQHTFSWRQHFVSSSSKARLYFFPNLCSGFDHRPRQVASDGRHRRQRRRLDQKRWNVRLQQEDWQVGGLETFSKSCWLFNWETSEAPFYWEHHGQAYFCNIS